MENNHKENESFHDYLPLRFLILHFNAQYFFLRFIFLTGILIFRSVFQKKKYEHRREKLFFISFSTNKIYLFIWFSRFCSLSSSLSTLPFLFVYLILDFIYFINNRITTSMLSFSSFFLLNVFDSTDYSANNKQNKEIKKLRMKTNTSHSNSSSIRYLFSC